MGTARPPPRLFPEMPRYFFDLLNGIGTTHDEEGTDLPDIAAARDRALREARPVIAHEILDGWLDLTGKIRVRSEAGEVLFEVRFDEAVDLKLPDD